MMMESTVVVLVPLLISNVRSSVLRLDVEYTAGVYRLIVIFPKASGAVSVNVKTTEKRRG